MREVHAVDGGDQSAGSDQSADQSAGSNIPAKCLNVRTAPDCAKLLSPCGMIILCCNFENFEGRPQMLTPLILRLKNQRMAGMIKSKRETAPAA
jgi:hypothetical protein